MILDVFTFFFNVFLLQCTGKVPVHEGDEDGAQMQKRLCTIEATLVQLIELCTTIVNHLDEMNSKVLSAPNKLCS